MIVDHNTETKVVNVVVEQEDMMATMKKEIFMDVNMVVMVSILEMIVDNNNQVMDPQYESVLMEEVLWWWLWICWLKLEICQQKVFKNSRKILKFLAGKSKELSGKLQVILRQWSQMCYRNCSQKHYHSFKRKSFLFRIVIDTVQGKKYYF